MSKNRNEFTVALEKIRTITNTDLFIKYKEVEILCWSNIYSIQYKMGSNVKNCYNNEISDNWTYRIFYHSKKPELHSKKMDQITRKTTILAGHYIYRDNRIN